MADTLQNKSTSEQFKNSNTQSTIPDSFYSTPLLNIFLQNKLTDAQASIKQIAKILKAIKPNDKKTRQQPMQGIIIKKFVIGIQGGLELMKALGFQETVVDNKPYLVFNDDTETSQSPEQIAESLLAIAATNPLDVPKASNTSMSDESLAKLTNTESASSTPLNESETATSHADKKSNTPPAPPPKCSTDCGFFANVSFNGMCSACHRKANPPKPADSTLLPLTRPGTQITKGPTSSFGIDTSNPMKEFSSRISKGFCTTPHCPFAAWKSAPASWKADLEAIRDEKRTKKDQQLLTGMDDGKTDAKVDAKTGESTMNDNDTKIERNGEMTPALQNNNATTTPTPIPPTPSKDTNNKENVKDIFLVPPTTCQYCTYSTFLKPPSAQSRTLGEKKRQFKLKCQALHGFSKVMREVQKDKSRCWSCNRKMGLAGIECRCGFVFCGHHRYPNEHQCSYDHMKRFTENLAKTTLNDITRGKLDDRDDE